MLTVENEKYAIECDSDGIIIIRNKNEGDETHLLIFNDKYQYLYKQWDVEPRLYLTSELEYLIITYGIGYIYIIDLCIKKIVRNYILFPEISYDDDSYQKIDTCCYYNEATEIDFSDSGKYAVIRVRGDYDPQEGDRRKILFTPIYFSSVFVLDMQTLEMVFSYDGSNMKEEGYNKNMAVIAMNPSENQLLIGALGNELKLFDINEGCEIQTFKDLAWHADPCDIRNCKLALFIDDGTFAYINKDYNIEIYTKQNEKNWIREQIIKTEIVKAGDRTKREREVFKLEYDKLMEEFVCNSVLRYKRRKINGTKRFGEKIFDRNRICKKI